MKKIISVLLLLALTAALFCGCKGKKAKTDRVLFNCDLGDYVTLGDYRKIAVNKSSEDFQAQYDAQIKSDVEAGGFYNSVTEGTVADGDTVNIDYEGKRDGVAFDGGTAQGYDLTIGSGSFIPGFEDKLIGVKIGDTVDLDLKFPDPYPNNPDLAGVPVVFTVKVNSAKQPKAPKEYFKEMDFDSEQAYLDDVTERALSEYLIDKVINDAEIKSYPEEDRKTVEDTMFTQYSTYHQSQYGVDLETSLSYSGMTLEDFKTQFYESSVKPLLDQQMVLYAILDKENMSVSKEDTDAQIKKMLDELKSEQVTRENLTDYYGKYYFEMLAVREKVEAFLVKNASVK